MKVLAKCKVFIYSKTTQIGVAHLAVAYIIKTATLLGTHRTAISQVMTAHTKGRHHRLGGTVTENQN